ncbi:hypothetical protein ACFQ08_02305 [Streptosporangium algeriense]|uniref:Uncharacterized protein n=1 Tax=Streptosporangium algeriense TaxID=1682748 RepID=A0ABW3DKG6_9ACTN
MRCSSSDATTATGKPRAAPLLLQLGTVAERIPAGSRNGGQGRVIREAISAFRAESRPYVEG